MYSDQELDLLVLLQSHIGILKCNHFHVLQLQVHFALIFVAAVYFQLLAVDATDQV